MDVRAPVFVVCYSTTFVLHKRHAVSFFDVEQKDSGIPGNAHAIPLFAYVPVYLIYGIDVKQFLFFLFLPRFHTRFLAFFQTF